MECKFPSYPLTYVNEEIIDALATHLALDDSWKLFAQEIDKLCNGALEFTTLKLLGIGSYKGNPARHILMETLRSNRVTTQTWQEAFIRLNLSAANILPKYLEVIRANYTRDQQYTFPGQLGSHHSCGCSSCRKINSNSLSIDGSSLYFTHSDVTSHNRDARCDCGESQHQKYGNEQRNLPVCTRNALSEKENTDIRPNFPTRRENERNGQSTESDGRRCQVNRPVNVQTGKNMAIQVSNYDSEKLQCDETDHQQNKQFTNVKIVQNKAYDDMQDPYHNSHLCTNKPVRQYQEPCLIGQSLNSQGHDGQDHEGQLLPYYVCSCDNCEKKRMLDPEETLLLKITNIKNDTEKPTRNKKQVLEPYGNRLYEGGNRKIRPAHNEHVATCTCEINKAYIDALAQAKCCCVDSPNGNSKTKQNRYSDPNEHFEHIAELKPRSSSDSDICKQCLHYPKTEKRRLRIFVSFADDGRRHVTEVINMISRLQKNSNFIVKYDLENRGIIRDLHFNKDFMTEKMSNVRDWIEYQYGIADFVIFCISPAYSEYVKPSNAEDGDNGAFPNNTRLHVRYIHDIARSEYCRNACKNKRFLPLVFPASGTKSDHVPLFLRSTILFKYPESFGDLYDFLNRKYCEL